MVFEDIEESTFKHFSISLQLYLNLAIAKTANDILDIWMEIIFTGKAR